MLARSYDAQQHCTPDWRPLLASCAAPSYADTAAVLGQQVDDHVPSDGCQVGTVQLSSKLVTNTSTGSIMLHRCRQQVRPPPARRRMRSVLITNLQASICCTVAMYCVSVKPLPSPTLVRAPMLVLYCCCTPGDRSRAGLQVVHIPLSKVLVQLL